LRANFSAIPPPIVYNQATRWRIAMRYILLVSLAAAIFGSAFPCASDEAPVRKRGLDGPRDWPMFGGGPSRNMVNLAERGLPADWCVEEGKIRNVKWVAELGGKTFSTPVVAEGMVFIGTNKPIRAGDRLINQAVLAAFRETDGQLLWENVHAIDADAPGAPFGLLSTPTVAGRSIYYVTPSCAVICADVGSGRIAWQYDMVKELKIVPGISNVCPAVALANFCAPLVIGDHVFVSTGNGRDVEGKLPAPDAASFVALHKQTGKLAWRCSLPGKNLVEGQWSSPAFAEIEDVPQVIFAGGDGVIYSFAPATGELLWKCDCLPFRKAIGDRDIDNYFMATPVVNGDRLYVGMGLAPDHGSGTRFSYFLCLDITKKGDVSLKSYDAQAAANKESALVWAFGGPIEPKAAKGRRAYFGRTLSTAAVHDGLVYIAEEHGYLQCLDAATGQRCCEHDFRATVLGSPYWVDGRVFVCTQDGEVVILAHGRTAQVLATIDMDAAIDSSPIAAHGTLYIATHKKLFAIGSR
jgi:outer membrane protein assembly factor BamB